MLNIQNRISFSKNSKKIIKKFTREINGALDAHSWSKIKKELKSEISRKLLANQNYKCVYCKRYLLGLGHEIDHFANKAHHPKFCFNPTNLFYSCHFCNSSSRKGSKNTVSIVSAFYRNCVFNIVHPYFNDVDNEIIYKDADKIYFDWASCTNLGRQTIVFFGYDDLEMTLIRSKTIVFERQNPLTTQEERKLIDLAISYK